MGTSNLLALYRIASSRHTFCALGRDSALGRVFAALQANEPDAAPGPAARACGGGSGAAATGWAADRALQAQRCRVRSTVLLPLYDVRAAAAAQAAAAARSGDAAPVAAPLTAEAAAAVTLPVAVFELAAHAPLLDFDGAVSLLNEALGPEGLSVPRLCAARAVATEEQQLAGALGGGGGGEGGETEGEDEEDVVAIATAVHEAGFSGRDAAHSPDARAGLGWWEPPAQQQRGVAASRVPAFAAASPSPQASPLRGAPGAASLALPESPASPGLWHAGSPSTHFVPRAFLPPLESLAPRPGERAPSPPALVLGPPPLGGARARRWSCMRAGAAPQAGAGGDAGALDATGPLSAAFIVTGGHWGVN
jgi:hypothetical protein